MDLFGLGSSTRLQSEEIALRLTAPWYTAPAQQNVAAILIDNDFVTHDPADDSAIGSWPMPYARYADLIEQLIPMKPSAIFIDITFQWPHADVHDSVDPFVDALQLAADNGIHIVLARAVVTAGQRGHVFCDGRDDAGAVSFEETPVVEPLVRLVNGSSGKIRFATVSSFGCQQHYPLLIGRDQSSPAYELARIVCSGSQRPKTCAPMSMRFMSGEVSQDELLKPMVIRWGAFPSRERVALGWLHVRSPCGDLQIPNTNGGPALLFRDLRASLSQAFIASPTRGNRLLCHYIDETFASTVVQNPQSAEHLVRDRVVLIGVAPSVAWDLAPNPVNGSVPGVIVHAAATENLIALGDHYVKVLDEHLLALIEIVLVVIAITVFTIGARQLEGYGWTTLNRRIRRRAQFFGIALILTMIALVRPQPSLSLLAVVVTLALWTVMNPEKLLLTSVCSLIGIALVAGLLHFGIGPANWIAVLLAVLSHAIGHEQGKGKHAAH